MKLNKQQKFVAGYSAAMFIALVMAYTGGSGIGMPDFTDAFPDAKLVTEESSEALDTYVFLSDSPFESTRTELAGFLGPDWKVKKMVEADYKQLAGYLDGEILDTLTGLAQFQNGLTPDVRVSLAQSKAPMSGRRFLSTLLVIRPKPGDGGH